MALNGPILAKDLPVLRDSIYNKDLPREAKQDEERKSEQLSLSALGLKLDVTNPNFVCPVSLLYPVSHHLERNLKCRLQKYDSAVESTGSS